MSTNKTEIYVRFQSADYGSGMFEAACHSIEEAAGQFAEDPDSISACALEIDTSGRLVSARDVTDAVVDHLKEMIREDSWSTSPHPMLDDFFAAWSEEAERDRTDQMDHERLESAMLNI
ncbi:hypothetical protein ACGYLO_17575 [Sulfitobacter sp. 1A13353]|mgnify:CR=1 FL=1|uniref:hypothetical protein n=1 Tax=Sulfitobacter sp. 1A13353 TaxID=3368568 RepID=UPI0037465108